jgi:glycosyltransferase involved in cell wall biosynthesis
MYLSIVLPVRNEAGTLRELHDRILGVCNTLNKPFEIIYVENGSTDDSLEILKSLDKAQVLVMRWKDYMRKAQSLAMDAGFKQAQGEFVIYMDSDLQVEPENIPKFLSKLEEGYDVVSGWRRSRKETNKFDPFLPIKFILRKIFGTIRHLLINEGVHDPGSAIKGFRREALEGLDLTGEMHRYIVAILHWQGFLITEIEVEHFPRRYGKSHYNIFKGFRGFADLLSIFIWRKYADRPLHYLGVGGLFISTMGSILLVVLLTLRAFNIMSLKDSIFPVLAILLILVGVQLFVSGIIADTLAKIFYSSDRNKVYTIKERLDN